MSHDATHNPAEFDWDDPHKFHHDDEGHHVDHGAHHVTSWQKLFIILIALLLLTGLTVAAATVEQWAVDLGFHITHFWNVVIALTIALIKAAMVCMYFMHLKHDNPLNTMILLTTLFVFGLFLLFTGIDLGTRGAVNPVHESHVQAGGTGVGMLPGGGSFGGNVTTVRRNQRIEQYAAAYAAQAGRETPDEDDNNRAASKFWASFYDYKVKDHPGKIPPRHADDADDHHADWLDHHIRTHRLFEISDADRSRPRHGTTPGLFDEAEADHANGDH